MFLQRHLFDKQYGIDPEAVGNVIFENRDILINGSFSNRTFCVRCFMVWKRPALCKPLFYTDRHKSFPQCFKKEQDEVNVSTV